MQITVHLTALDRALLRTGLTGSPADRVTRRGGFCRLIARKGIGLRDERAGETTRLAGVMSVRELSDLWDQRWPGIDPDGYDLKWVDALDSVWVRFHSLSGSKRYAESPEETAEVLRRHNVVLAELGLRDRCFASTTWFEPKDTPGHPGASWWRTIDADLEKESSELQLYASVETYPSAELDSLLVRVANDGLSGTIIMPADGRWLYHPYDGGADVFAQTTAQRDALVDRHRSWLSDHPSGL